MTLPLAMKPPIFRCAAAMAAMRIKPFASRAARLLVSVLLANLSITVVRAETTAPIDTAQSFFSWALVRHASPLPSPKERVEIANWMTPDLMTLLDTALITQDLCIRTAPKGDKPNLLEGDIFVGNEEGATEAAYQVTKPLTQQVVGKAVVTVDMVYVDQRWPRGDRRRTVA